MHTGISMNQDHLIAQGIDHVAIDVANMARSKAFYGDLLGLREVARPESFDFAGAWYRIGPVDLHLVQRDAPQTGGGRHFCFWVQDAHSTAARLQAAGCAVAWETRYKIRGVDRFFIHDPDGNRIEFHGPDGTGEDRYAAGQSVLR
jgi:catechol 2,3-dioxygenase-like lactoylglutathione lyase family enzyme